MSLLNNSKDALNLAIALSVIGFTFFLCWTIFYMAMILRHVLKSVKEMREMIRKIEEVIKTIKEKVESSISYLLLISEGMKKLVEVIKNHSDKKKETGE